MDRGPAAGSVVSARPSGCRAWRRPRRRPRRRRRGVEVVGQRGEHRLDAPGRPARRRRARAPGASASTVSTASQSSVVGPLPVGAVVVAQQHQPDRHRVDVAVAQRGDEDQVAPRLRHLLAVVADHPGVARRPGRTACPGRRPGRGRRTSRGAGRPGRCRRPGRRRRRRGAPARSRCTRCASRAGPARTGCPTTARRRARRATRRSRAGPSCPGGRGRRRARGRSRASARGPAGLLAEGRVGGDREVEVVLDLVDRAGGLRAARSASTTSGIDSTAPT